METLLYCAAACGGSMLFVVSDLMTLPGVGMGPALRMRSVRKREAGLPTGILGGAAAVSKSPCFSSASTTCSTLCIAECSSKANYDDHADAHGFCQYHGVMDHAQDAVGLQRSCGFMCCGQ